MFIVCSYHALPKKFRKKIDLWALQELHTALYMILIFELLRAIKINDIKSHLMKM